MKIEIEEAPRVEKPVTMMLTLLPSEAKSLLETIADSSFFYQTMQLYPLSHRQPSPYELREQLVKSLRDVAKR